MPFFVSTITFIAEVSLASLLFLSITWSVISRLSKPFQNIQRFEI